MHDLQLHNPHSSGYFSHLRREVAFEKPANAGGRFTHEEETRENCRKAQEGFFFPKFSLTTPKCLHYFCSKEFYLLLIRIKTNTWNEQNQAEMSGVSGEESEEMPLQNEDTREVRNVRDDTGHLNLRESSMAWCMLLGTCNRQQTNPSVNSSHAKLSTLLFWFLEMPLSSFRAGRNGNGQKEADHTGAVAFFLSRANQRIQVFIVSTSANCFVLISCPLYCFE